jgi:hypothetical protein
MSSFEPFNPRKRHVYRDAAWTEERAMLVAFAEHVREFDLSLYEREIARIPLWLAVLRWLAR